MKIFSGTSNTPLAEKIAHAFNLSLSPLEIHLFPDGEKRVRVIDTVVDQDCVIVQSAATPADVYYMELFFIVDALKRSGAKSITAVVSYLGYQRQDHVFRDGEAVSLAVVARALEAAGITRLITFDLHSIKTPEIFHIPVDHLSALSLFAEKIKELLAFSSQSSTCLVSPDMGGVRRIKILSELLGNMSYAAVLKNRDLATGQITAEKIDGEIKETAFIVDDMISTGKTIVQAAKLLQERGAKNIFVFATHPVFSKNAPEILQNLALQKVFVTNTIDVPKKKWFSTLEILSIAPLIAQKIKDIV